MASSGTSTAGLVFGGNPGVTSTDSWNGTNWSVIGDLSTARSELTGDGTQTSAIAFGGLDPSAVSNSTEEWYGNGIIREIISSS